MRATVHMYPNTVWVKEGRHKRSQAIELILYKMPIKGKKTEVD